MCLAKKLENSNGKPFETDRFGCSGVILSSWDDGEDKGFHTIVGGKVSSFLPFSRAGITDDIFYDSWVTLSMQISRTPEGGQVKFKLGDKTLGSGTDFKNRDIDLEQKLLTWVAGTGDGAMVKQMKMRNAALQTFKSINNAILSQYLRANTLEEALLEGDLPEAEYRCAPDSIPPPMVHDDEGVNDEYSTPSTPPAFHDFQGIPVEITKNDLIPEGAAFRARPQQHVLVTGSDQTGTVQMRSFVANDLQLGSRDFIAGFQMYISSSKHGPGYGAIFGLGIDPTCMSVKAETQEGRLFDGTNHFCKGLLLALWQDNYRVGLYILAGGKVVDRLEMPEVSGYFDRWLPVTLQVSYNDDEGMSGTASWQLEDKQVGSDIDFFHHDMVGAENTRTLGWFARADEYSELDGVALRDLQLKTAADLHDFSVDQYEKAQVLENSVASWVAGLACPTKEYLDILREAKASGNTALEPTTAVPLTKADFSVKGYAFRGRDKEVVLAEARMTTGRAFVRSSTSMQLGMGATNFNLDADIFLASSESAPDSPRGSGGEGFGVAWSWGASDDCIADMDAEQRLGFRNDLSTLGAGDEEGEEFCKGVFLAVWDSGTESGVYTVVGGKVTQVAPLPEGSSSLYDRWVPVSVRVERDFGAGLGAGTVHFVLDSGDRTSKPLIYPAEFGPEDVEDGAGFGILGHTDDIYEGQMVFRDAMVHTAKPLSSSVVNEYVDAAHVEDYEQQTMVEVLCGPDQDQDQDQGEEEERELEQAERKLSLTSYLENPPMALWARDGSASGGPMAWSLGQYYMVLFVCVFATLAVIVFRRNRIAYIRLVEGNTIPM